MKMAMPDSPPVAGTIPPLLWQRRAGSPASPAEKEGSRRKAGESGDGSVSHRGKTPHNNGDRKSQTRAEPVMQPA